MHGIIIIFFLGGGGAAKENGMGAHIWPKTPKMALISKYLAADSSPDTSADALAIINMYRIISARGCTLACSFIFRAYLNSTLLCTTHALSTHYVRSNSLGNKTQVLVPPNPAPQ